MDDVWEAPIGAEVAVAVPADGAHVEQLIWHGDDNTAGGDLTVVVARRSADVVTLRLRRGERLVADIRLRRGDARTGRPHGLLRTDPGPGTSCTRLFPVTAGVTTDHVPDAEPVLSTPSLIAFMEDTAAAVLRPRFGPATAALGTWIGIRHTGPALRGQTVSVTAVLAEVRGRRYLFDVEATVDGRAVGDGQVAQTLIRLD
ncbi:hypothetical protein GCM10010399_91520 [Dactylosporangium fulvum]|uniref:Fluoroacetyl-CoA-specific thioesterase-like domain-containing protein n=1 Tax=Dactylosporangium fulvum TaxID=53359 RepID=A0ABY5VND3_9ACTN|nr:hypothetical protein [Dactylosporangium fulvum]UWP78594.1 hypothetical protein Dfulv_25790 [Dactylosporangium fulvum]